MKNSNVKWVCSLSNGQTLYEGKGDYQEGGLSPWLKLKKYLEENREVFITSLSLYTDEGHRWNLPSAGKQPKFRELEKCEKPLKYTFFRKAGMDMDMGGGNRETERYAVIEASYKDYKIQVWVREEKPHASWSLIL